MRNTPLGQSKAYQPTTDDSDTEFEFSDTDVQSSGDENEEITFTSPCTALGIDETHNHHARKGPDSSAFNRDLAEYGARLGLTGAEAKISSFWYGQGECFAEQCDIIFRAMG